jgi:hypothetical protein
MIKIKITFWDKSYRTYSFSTKKAADDFIHREGDAVSKVEWL